MSIAAHRSDDDHGHLLALCLAAAVVGVGTGGVTSAFRWLLHNADRLRGNYLDWAHTYAIVGFLAVITLGAAAVGLSAFLVRRLEPHAEGGGIPWVEGVVDQRIEPGGFRLLPVKFIGGVLAIGGGLPLGREGLSVQMGANVAHMVGTISRRTGVDSRILMAAGGGAGMAAAFNAPLAGGVFVLEELLKRFDTRITLATIVTSGTSIWVVHATVGNALVLPVSAVGEVGLQDVLAVAAVGLIAAVAGIVFNRCILAALHQSDRSRLPTELRAALIGAAVLGVAWFAPTVVGGVDPLTVSVLNGHHGAWVLVGLFALSLLIGSFAYSAGVPGGLMAPLLVLGAISGAFVGVIGERFWPGHVPSVVALGIIGLAAIFTASIRAPITGMILATEMTGAVSLLPPMLGACAIAMFIATYVNAEPIYDALTRRSIAAAELNEHVPKLQRANATGGHVSDTEAETSTGDHQ